MHKYAMETANKNKGIAKAWEHHSPKVPKYPKDPGLNFTSVVGSSILINLLKNSQGQTLQNYNNQVQAQKATKWQLEFSIEIQL